MLHKIEDIGKQRKLMPEPRIRIYAHSSSQHSIALPLQPRGSGALTTLSISALGTASAPVSWNDQPTKQGFLLLTLTAR
jgi:hypothetical protein